MDMYLEYLRISRTDRLFNDDPLKTLERHEQILSDLQKRDGYHVVQVFREVVSGESISERPEVQKLLKLVETGNYAGVLVIDTDRLARGDTIDQGIISRAFQITGTKIVTPSKVYDPLDEFDNDYFEYSLFMGRKEYKLIKKRLNRGRLSSANEGKFVGSRPPYGYDKYKLPNQKGYSLMPNTDADTVVQIFNLFNGIGHQRIGIKSIASYLNDCNIASPAGGLWSGNTVGSILRNPVYAGYIRYNYKKEEKNFRDGQVVKSRKINSDSFILVNGLHDGLISDDLFRQTQTYFNRNQIPRVKDDLKLKNPLSGIVFCAKCGHAMVRKKSRDEMLICTHYGCDNVGSYTRLIEQEILHSLRNYTDEINPDSEQQDDDFFRISEYKRSVDMYKDKIALLNKKYDKLYDLLEQDVYTLDVFRERKEKLDADIHDLHEKLSAEESKLSDAQRTLAAKTAFIPRSKHLLDNYDIMSVEEKNSALKSLIDHIDYCKSERNKKGNGSNVNFEIVIYPRL